MSQRDNFISPQARGLKAISRWLRSNATTPPVCDQKRGRIPEGCQTDDGVLRSLRDRVICGRVVRGCRFAQPPANGWHPSGMAAARVDEHLKKMGAVWK